MDRQGTRALLQCCELFRLYGPGVGCAGCTMLCYRQGVAGVHWSKLVGSWYESRAGEGCDNSPDSTMCVRTHRPEGDRTARIDIGDGCHKSREEPKHIYREREHYNTPVAKAEKNLREKLKGPPPLCDRDIYLSAMKLRPSNPTRTPTSTNDLLAISCPYPHISARQPRRSGVYP